MRVSVSLAAAGLVLAAAATAEGVTDLAAAATAEGVTDLGSVTAQLIAAPGEDVWVLSPVRERTIVGVYIMEKLGGAGYSNPSGKGLELSNPFDAVCVDLYGLISMRDPQTFTVTYLEEVPQGDGASPMGPVRANNIQELVGRYWLSLTTNVRKAAFGAAVWEIVNEDPWERDGTDPKPWDLDSGNFMVTGSSPQWPKARDLAESWLASLTGDPAPVQAYGLYAPDTQDFAVVVPGLGGFIPIPEPVTLLGLVLGVGTLGGYVRRRRL